MSSEKLIFNWNPQNSPTERLSRIVLLNGEEISKLIHDLLPLTNHNLGHPLETSKQLVIFDPRIEQICCEYLDEVKKIQEKDHVLAAYLASRLFESFSSYWIDELLAIGKHIVAIGFWKKILSIIKNWEENNNFRIHKGTPYFFLAETYLLVGDFDGGFIAMSNAIKDDRFLPELNYPKEAPVYWTATMLDKPNNHMYQFIVRKSRLRLSQFIKNYNIKYNQNFTINTFDQKFLSNDDLLTTVYFFVYNFFVIDNLEKNHGSELLENEFSMIRILDIIFNFTICIDEILKYSSLQNNVHCKTLYESIRWWVCDKKQWINKSQFQDIVSSQLQLNKNKPDETIPLLLANMTQPMGDFRKEMHTMLLAYHLRNHGGHNLDQQKILVSSSKKIIESIFMSIFLAVETLP